MPIEVQDLAHFAAATFGYTFPDPNPEVRKQWAVFDAFIKLMTPQGFADLMGTMWPELIDAMPLGMGPHDAPHGQGPRRAEPDEADVPGALPAPAAADAAQGDGDHAQEGRGADRDARIHARADAGSFLFRQNFCLHLVNAQLLCNSFGRPAAVTREHDDLDPFSVQIADRLGR